ncbi:hypothetical protein N864_15790 [Intrasporangium chromatireducens Q5-1]|uniref:Uncharacterized protein n=1 Tax=Intrasporangium chromatireducens Q5-1 TaxID=584657 RepID=W9GGQ2_9MICO|nr:hypothetical protein [Intrasporangium chromatireducens]EWT03988.1 hypothetical protein N864_15790 [Intrasporangium chromatireducens Q5-1]
MMTGQLEYVHVLVPQLQALGVTLPPEVVSGSERLVRLGSLRPQPRPTRKLIGLTEAELTTELRELGVAMALADDAGPGPRAVGLAYQIMQEEIAATARDIADDILTEIRPSFDAAASVVRRAVDLGINSRTTHEDILRADDVATARDAWSAIPEATRTLDAVADARMTLSMVTGVAPAPERGRNAWGRAVQPGEWIGAAFTRSALPWRQEFEDTWQMWLRLSGPAQVELLTLDEAAVAAKNLGR